MKRKAKIIATIGPASSSPDILEKLIDSGLNFARLNMSHGTHQSHGEVCERIREISRRKGRAVGILLDLQGPRIRTGHLPSDQEVELETGSIVQITSDSVMSTSEIFQVDYPYLVEDLTIGDRILIADGQLELKILKISAAKIEAEVLSGGFLGASKGVNFPGVNLSIKGLQEKDYDDLAFGLELRVDAVAMSFVSSGEDMMELRKAIIELSPQDEHIPIIAKLERPQALDQLDSILQNSDGVMIARGDLGVEVSPEKVPSLQKQIIKNALARRKFTITATQMLESMVHHTSPTRAEASDVANAVFDGSDALMLSGETSIGDHPVRSVLTMDRIILDAESHSSEWGIKTYTDDMELLEVVEATAVAARSLAQNCAVAAIAVFTRSGRTAQLMANARPREPILAFTPEIETYRQLAILWGVEPHLVAMSKSVEAMIEHVEEALLGSEMITRGEKVVLVASLPIGAMGPANFVLLHTIE
jgi:pyruvate kinase